MVLLDHEAEELQAARAFLSEVRRQYPKKLVPSSRLRGLIRWDETRQEYQFCEWMARRVQQHYLRVGASPN
jgi:tRNA isopentenyl-2-thiomethyl-A-37 hydroxylase MiaE